MHAGALAALPLARLSSLPPPLRAREEIGTLIYAVARASGQLDRLAPAERDRLRELYRGNAALNQARFTQLDAIVGAARSAGLKLVLLKGALLARTCYGDLGARAMVDFDLVCAPDQLERAVSLLSGLGFERVDEDPARAAAGAQHDVKLVAGPTQIELHFRLWHEIGLDPDPRGLLARAVEVPFGAGRAWAPAPADHLFFLLAHAATHGFAGNPMWIPDAVLVAAAAGPSVWTAVEARARQSGGELALLAARDHLDGALPGVAPPPARERARLRRLLLRRIAPWLQRGEPALGLLPSRLVRPLLFDGRAALAGWVIDKLALRRALGRR